MNLFSMSPRKGCPHINYQQDKFWLHLARAVLSITTSPDVSEDGLSSRQPVAGKGVLVHILALRDTLVSKSIVQYVGTFMALSPVCNKMEQINESAV